MLVVTVCGVPSVVAMIDVGCGRADPPSLPHRLCPSSMLVRTVREWHVLEFTARTSYFCSPVRLWVPLLGKQQTWATIARFGANMASIARLLAELWPKLAAKVWPTRPRFGQHRSFLVDILQMLARIGQDRPRARPAKSWGDSANLGRNWAESRRSRGNCSGIVGPTVRQLLSNCRVRRSRRGKCFGCVRGCSQRVSL